MNAAGCEMVCTPWAQFWLTVAWIGGGTLLFIGLLWLFSKPDPSRSLGAGRGPAVTDHSPESAVVQRMRETGMCEPPSHHWQYCPPGFCACGRMTMERMD